MLGGRQPADATAATATTATTTRTTATTTATTTAATTATTTTATTATTTTATTTATTKGTLHRASRSSLDLLEVFVIVLVLLVLVLLLFRSSLVLLKMICDFVVVGFVVAVVVVVVVVFCCWFNYLCYSGCFAAHRHAVVRFGSEVSVRQRFVRSEAVCSKASANALWKAEKQMFVVVQVSQLRGSSWCVLELAIPGSVGRCLTH
ncbi:unnamed protein product [Polarella glacialis]|uniref:Uncharacterized protein n=2 Tax=Polarella glacialis TaxID=89957 RepID=A0A813G4M9_POLGL|nr:unnamed protein product [Polarella glacialis]